MNLTRTTDAASECLSLIEVKNHLRIGSATADHDSLRHFIAAIRHRTELFLGKTLITSTWELKLDAFCDVVQLPMAPVQSISSISYVDTDGDSQTFTNFQYDKKGRVAPTFGNSWPSTRAQFDAVTITYIAGETDAGQVQEDIKHAMLLWIGEADVQREDVVVGAGVIMTKMPKGAEAILEPHKRIVV